MEQEGKEKKKKGDRMRGDTENAKTNGRQNIIEDTEEIEERGETGDKGEMGKRETERKGKNRRKEKNSKNERIIGRLTFL